MVSRCGDSVIHCDAARSQQYVEALVFMGLSLFPVVPLLFPGGQAVRRCRGNDTDSKRFQSRSSLL